MLSRDPACRPTTRGIRARKPLRSLQGRSVEDIAPEDHFRLSRQRSNITTASSSSNASFSTSSNISAWSFCWHGLFLSYCSLSSASPPPPLPPFLPPSPSHDPLYPCFLIHHYILVSSFTIIIPLFSLHFTPPSSSLSSSSYFCLHLHKEQVKQRSSCNAADGTRHWTHTSPMHSHCSHSSHCTKWCRLSLTFVGLV